MAVSASFKQRCPSCEAMISVKETMIGKKVECTKCKDKFIAERPDEDDEDDKPQKKESGKKNTGVGAKTPPGKRPKLEVDDDDDDAPSNGKSKSKSQTNGKPPKKAPKDDDDDGDDDAKKKPKKAAGGVSKLTIGLGLAVVGVVILSVAAYLLLAGGGSGGGPRGNPNPNVKIPPEEDEKKDDKKEDKKPRPIEPVASALTDAEVAKLTNLLPPDSEHVFHAFMGNILGSTSPLREPAFTTPGALDDAELKKRVGFSVQAIDDLQVAERYTAPGWRYTIIHLKEVIREDQLKTALRLKPLSPIKDQLYYELGEANPWFDQLGRFSFGVPNQLRALDGRDPAQPSYVRIHGPQTLIVADKTPMLALLNAGGQFTSTPTKSPDPKPDPGKSPPPDTPQGKLIAKGRWEGEPGGEFVGLTFTAGGNVLIQGNPALEGTGKWSLKDTMVTVTNPAKNFTFEGMLQDKMITGTAKRETVEENWSLTFKPQEANPQPEPNPTPGVSDDNYLTLRQSLRDILRRMEARGTDGKSNVIYSSATDMSAAKIDFRELKDGVVRRPRQVWDVTLMLTERTPRIRHLGTTLLQHDAMKYQLRNEITCGQELDAEDIRKELTVRTAPAVARFIQKLTGHEVKAVSPEKKEEPKTAPDQVEKQPEEKKAMDVNASQVSVNHSQSTVEFTLDLVLDNPAIMKLQAITALAASSMRVDMEMAANLSLRHVLAKAGQQLGEKGLTDREVPAGRFPPGAFPRLDAALRADKEPKNRISWMAGLLPYMGHQTLYGRIDFNSSWRHPNNWLAGNNIVPQFLDPSYPNNARQIAIDGLPADFAATHYVGIAGVGLDAASYKRGDPATKQFQGVLGYDGSANIKDVYSGRGISNTILMIQVPHDGVTGVSPWIAGGGATLRGVPEKNSIAPFVLTTDKTGKVIQNGNKRGTYVLMTDGTVRFIDQNISDDVFKAMCTVEGNTPPGFDPSKDPNIRLIPMPKVETPKVEPKVEPKVDPKVDPMPKVEPKVDEKKIETNKDK